MNKSPLARAVSLALLSGAVATVLSVDASAAQTMYNLYNANANGLDSSSVPLPCAPCKGPVNAALGFTDGWVWGGPNPANGFQGGVSGGSATAATPGWVGTSGPTTTPFGSYIGAHPLNWGFRLFSSLDSGVISNADALARYGVSADIDTARGAWFDNGNPGNGWKHDLDTGLFRSNVTTPVKLSIQGVNFADTNYGFTVFKGMTSNSTVGYVHHGSWNANQNGTPVPDTNDFGFTAADIVATTDTSGPIPLNLNELVFLAEADQFYTIVLGGWRDGTWFNTNDGYVLSVSAVPLPAAVWLLGSALGGLAAVRRRTPTLA